MSYIQPRCIHHRIQLNFAKTLILTAVFLQKTFTRKFFIVGASEYSGEPMSPLEKTREKRKVTFFSKEDKSKKYTFTVDSPVKKPMPKLAKGAGKKILEKVKKKSDTVKLRSETTGRVLSFKKTKKE